MSLRYANLSPFAHFLVDFMSNLEIGFTITYAHKNIVQAWFDCQDLYTFTDSHVNNLFMGDPATSKSYILKVMEALLISGTTIRFTTVTAAACSYGVNPRNWRISLIDELPPAAFGLVQEKKQGGPVQDRTTTDDQAAQMKASLTSCYWHKIVTVPKQAEDGSKQHDTQLIVTESNSVYVACTNATSDMIAPAMADRFVRTVFRTNGGHRIDRPSGHLNIDVNEDPFRVACKEALVAVCRRNQILHAHIRVAMDCGFLPRVNMKLLNMLWDTILQETRALGSTSMGKTRVTKAFRSLCESVCITRAIVNWFDSGFTTSHTKDGYAFAPSQLIQLIPHLACTMEDIVLSLGLRGDSHEDRSEQSTVAAITRRYFPVNPQQMVAGESEKDVRARLYGTDLDHPEYYRFIGVGISDASLFQQRANAGAPVVPRDEPDEKHARGKAVSCVSLSLFSSPLFFVLSFSLLWEPLSLCPVL